VAALLVAQWESLFLASRTQGLELLFWAALIVAVNFLPLNLGEITVTLDMSILVAVSLLYQPPVAVLIGVVAAIDVRELEGRVSLLRAVFNRAQIGLSVLAASVVFHSFAESVQSEHRVVLGTVIAVLTFHVTNLTLVIIHTRLRTRTWHRLSVGGPVQFLITYLGYGALGLVLARLFTDVGAWSVVILLIPIAVAREALLRAQRLQVITNQLREKEKQLERHMGQIVEERRDERIRIGAELHDEVLQSLIRVSQLGAFIRDETPPRSQVGMDAAEVVSVAERAIQELRQVVADLRKSPLGRQGLIPTLKSLGRDMQLEWRVPIHVEAAQELDLSEEEQLLLYQVAKEGIINAVKHAEPNAVSVRLGERGSSVYLEVRDDGRGFDADTTVDPDGYGLGLLRERVERQGGEVVLASGKAGGTSLSVLLPKEAESDTRPASKSVNNA
jgi:signal transduction histidine kinase